MKGVLRHTLFVANDNDFIGTATDMNHPNGIDNLNQFFVFTFGDADLPGYGAQRLPGGAGGHDDKVCRSSHDDDGDHGHHHGRDD